MRWAAAAAATLLGACAVPPPVAPPPAATVTAARYEAADAASLPAVGDADLRAAWPALLASCTVFERQRERGAPWTAACIAARAARDPEAMRAVLARHFDAYRLVAETRAADRAPARVLAASDRGLLTGYYEPLLEGSRTRDARFSVPLYGVPEDLVAVELSALYPELAGRRVRGRLVTDARGRRVLPYYARAEIDGEQAPLAGRELLWVEDALEAFFLHVQGSGRVRLRDGSIVRVAYADTNGHPYRSIGAWLVERGELTPAQATMQGIQDWARAHPHRLRELLAVNPSYTFFRELPLGNPDAGPVGAFGVALTAGASAAVDPQFVPLGAPLLLQSEHPLTGEPLVRLVLAHDTGGAIRGPLRFDLFWGTGAAAAEPAGRQRHAVKAWLLLPRGAKPPAMRLTSPAEQLR